MTDPKEFNHTYATLSRTELLDLMYWYNEYIQEANDFDKYKDGWYPVCIAEFYDCEYEEWKKTALENKDI